MSKKSNNKNEETVVKEAKNAENLKVFSFKQQIDIFLKNNIDFSDYKTFYSELKKLSITKEMDNSRIIEMNFYRKKINNNIQKVIDKLVIEISTVIDGNINDMETIKQYFIDTKKNVTSNCTRLDEILTTIAKCNAIDKKAWLKLKGYNGWNTPLIKIAPNKYVFFGFTNDSDVVLTTSGITIDIEVLPLVFSSKAQSKHFSKLTDAGKAIIEKEVRKQLASVNGNELDSIINVQKEIKRQIEEKKEKAKAEKMLKSYNKLKASIL